MHLNFLTLLLLLLLLGFSSFLSISAVPATRTQNLRAQHDNPPLPYLGSHQENRVMELVKDEGAEEEQMEVVEEKMMERRRIILETQDYGWTGANTDHNPKFPGGL